MTNPMGQRAAEALERAAVWGAFDALGGLDKLTRKERRQAIRALEELPADEQLRLIDALIPRVQEALQAQEKLLADAIKTGVAWSQAWNLMLAQAAHERLKLNYGLMLEQQRKLLAQKGGE